MQLISEMIRGIAVIILLSVCLELLLPRSELQPYIRTVTGLLLIVAVLTPLTKARADIDLAALFSGGDHARVIYDDGSALAESWQLAAEEEYLRNLDTKIESLLRLDADVVDIKADCGFDEQGVAVSLKITSLDVSETKLGKWRETLGAYFSLPAERINIEAQRSENDG